MSFEVLFTVLDANNGRCGDFSKVFSRWVVPGLLFVLCSDDSRHVKKKKKKEMS